MRIWKNTGKFEWFWSISIRALQARLHNKHKKNELLLKPLVYPPPFEARALSGRRWKARAFATKKCPKLNKSASPRYLVLFRVTVNVTKTMGSGTMKGQSAPSPLVYSNDPPKVSYSIFRYFDIFFLAESQLSPQLTPVVWKRRGQGGRRGSGWYADILGVGKVHTVASKTIRTKLQLTVLLSKG
jgi:hypothetical protein